MLKHDDLSIKHRYSDHEMAELARTQSRKLAEKGVLESELGAVKKDFAGRIETCDAQVKSLSARISANFEYRNQKCLLLDERPDGFRISIRLDTGRIVKRRKLSPEERQVELTTEEPEPYVAIAMLPVDDEDWHDVDLYQCPVKQDEFEALRGVVEMHEYKPPTAMISA